MYNVAFNDGTIREYDVTQEVDSDGYSLALMIVIVNYQRKNEAAAVSKDDNDVITERRKKRL
jgi:hypothetical protein